MPTVMNLLYVFETVCLLCATGEWIIKQHAAEVFGKEVKETFTTLPNSSCNKGTVGHIYSDLDNRYRTYRICLSVQGRLVERTFSCPNGTVFHEGKKSCVTKSIFPCRRKRPAESKLKRFRRGLNPPRYSYHNLPTTNFTCLGKALGGYYADPETDCQMFHICTPGENNGVIDIMFLCGNGTVFDQRKLVCERYGLVDCHDSASYLDEEQRRLREDEEHRRLADVEITRIRSN